MNLFSPHPDDNLLPYDGIVNDYGVIFTLQQADDYLAYLEHNIAWRHDEAVIYGKHIITARQVAWYGEQNFAYTYSGTTRTALPPSAPSASTPACSTATPTAVRAWRGTATTKPVWAKTA